MFEGTPFNLVIIHWWYVSHARVSRPAGHFSLALLTFAVAQQLVGLINCTCVRWSRPHTGTGPWRGCTVRRCDTGSPCCSWCRTCREGTAERRQNPAEQTVSSDARWLEKKERKKKKRWNQTLADAYEADQTFHDLVLIFFFFLQSLLHLSLITSFFYLSLSTSDRNPLRSPDCGK